MSVSRMSHRSARLLLACTLVVHMTSVARTTPAVASPVGVLNDSVTVEWSPEGAVTAQLTVPVEEVCIWSLRWGSAPDERLLAARSDAQLPGDLTEPVADCGVADDLPVALEVPTAAAAVPVTLDIELRGNSPDQVVVEQVVWPPALSQAPVVSIAWAPDGHTRQVTVATSDVFCSVFATFISDAGPADPLQLTPTSGCAASATTFALPSPPAGTTAVSVQIGTLPTGGTFSDPIVVPFATAAPLTSARATLTAAGDLALAVDDPNPPGVVCVWRWRALVDNAFVYGVGSSEQALAEPAPECGLAPVIPSAIAQTASEIAAAPDVADGALGEDSPLWVSSPFHYDATITSPVAADPGGPAAPSAFPAWTPSGVLRLEPLGSPIGTNPCRWRIEWHQPSSWVTYGAWHTTSPGESCNAPPAWFDLPEIVESGDWSVSVAYTDAAAPDALSAATTVELSDSALAAPLARVSTGVDGYDTPVLHVVDPPALACLLVVQWRVAGSWLDHTVAGDGTCTLPLAAVTPHAYPLDAPAGADGLRFRYHRGPARGAFPHLGAATTLSWPSIDPPVDVTAYEQPDGSVDLTAVFPDDQPCAARWRVVVPGGFAHGAGPSETAPTAATTCTAEIAIPAELAAAHPGAEVSIAVDTDGSGADVYAGIAHWSETVTLPTTYVSTPLAGGTEPAPSVALSSNVSGAVVATVTAPDGVSLCDTPVRLEWEKVDGSTAPRGTWLSPCWGVLALPQTAAPVWGAGTWRIWAAYGDGTAAVSSFVSTTITVGGSLAAPSVRIVSPGDGTHTVEFRGTTPTACQLVVRWLTPAGWSAVVDPGNACSLPSPTNPFPLSPPVGATELALALRASTGVDSTGDWATIAWPPPAAAASITTSETAAGAYQITPASPDGSICVWRWRVLAGVGVDQTVAATGAGASQMAESETASCTPTVTIPASVAGQADVVGIELHPDVDGTGTALETYTDGIVDGLWETFELASTYVSAPVPASAQATGPSLTLRWSTSGVPQAVVTGCVTARIEWVHADSSVAPRGRSTPCGVVDLVQLHGESFSPGTWTVRAAALSGDTLSSAYTTRIFDASVDADSVLFYTNAGAVRAAVQGGSIWCNLRWRTGTGSGNTWETTGTFYAAPLGTCTGSPLLAGVEVAAALAAGTAVEVTPMPTPDTFAASWFGYTGPVTAATAEIRWTLDGAPVVVVDDPNPAGVVCFFTVKLDNGTLVQPDADAEGNVTCDPSGVITLPVGSRPLWVRPSGVPHVSGAEVWSIAQQALVPAAPALVLDGSITPVTPSKGGVAYDPLTGFHKVSWKPTATCTALVQYTVLDDPLVDANGQPLWRTANGGAPVTDCATDPLYGLTEYLLADELYGTSKPVGVRVAPLAAGTTAASSTWQRGPFVERLFGGTQTSSALPLPVPTVHVGKPFISITATPGESPHHCLVRYELRRNGVVVDTGHMRKDNATAINVCHVGESWMLPCSTSAPQVCSLSNPGAYSPQLQNGDELRFAFQRGGLTNFYDPDGSSGLTPGGVAGWAIVPEADQPVTGPWTDWVTWSGNDTAVPSVSFLSPLPGRHMRQTIAVRANPTDDVGVQRVDLYVDGQLSGTAYAAPWIIEFDTTTIADGNATLDLRVWDHAGKTSMARRSMFVDNTAPEVAFTAPAADATVAGWVQVTATVADPSGTPRFLELWVDDTLYTRVRPNNPSTWWNTKLATDGAHTLVWKVTDRAGNTTEASRTVTVDNAAPTVSVLWPNPGRHVRTTINVRPSFTGSDIAWTTLYVNGEVQSTTAGSPVSVPLDTTNFADGPIYIVFRVADAAGNVAWSPTRVVMVDNTKPQVRFINPSPWPNKLVTAPETVTADVTESAPLRFLALYVNNMFYAAASEASPSVTFDPTGYTGPVTLKWVAVDIAGNRGVVSRTVSTS